MASASFCLVAVLLAFAAVASADNFDAHLTGDNVVTNITMPTSGAGDTDGFGTAVVYIDDSFICLTAAWAKLDTVTRYHIHKNVFGARGPVVVNWVDEGSSSFPMNKGNFVNTCNVNNMINNSPEVTPELRQDIRNNPSGYYVDLHTPETRNYNGVTVNFQMFGAVRGQLMVRDQCKAAGICCNDKEACVDGMCVKVKDEKKD